MGVSLSFLTIRESFNRENPTFSNLLKFSPTKVSRYMVDCHPPCVLCEAIIDLCCDVAVADGELHCASLVQFAVLQNLPRTRGVVTFAVDWLRVKGE